LELLARNSPNSRASKLIELYIEIDFSSIERGRKKISVL
jgi:hypothetical protein